MFNTLIVVTGILSGVFLTIVFFALLFSSWEAAALIFGVWILPLIVIAHRKGRQPTSLKP